MYKRFIAMLLILLLAVPQINCFAGSTISGQKKYAPPNTSLQYWGDTIEGNYLYVMANSTAVPAADAGYTNGLRVYNISDTDNLVDVTDASNTDLKLDNTNSDPNKLLIAGNGYLYAAVWGATKCVKRFDLSNPANPKLVNTYTFTSSPKNLELNGDYLYVVGDCLLTAIKLSTGEKKEVAGSSGFFDAKYKNGYLYCSSTTGKFQVFNVSDFNAITSVGTISIPGFFITELELTGNYVVLVGYYTADSYKRYFITIDVSDLSNLSTAKQIVYPNDGTALGRICTIIAEGNLLYAGDIDKAVYIFDIANPTNIQQLTKFTGLTVNNYFLIKKGNKLFSICRSNGVTTYDVDVARVNITSLNNGDNVTSRPIRIEGYTINADTVDLKIGSLERTIQCDQNGKFTYTVEDEFLADANGAINGSYIITGDIRNAKGTTDEVTKTINLNLPKAVEVTFDGYYSNSSKISEVTGDEINSTLNVRSNLGETKNFTFLTALYKDGIMLSYTYETKSSDSGLFTNKINILPSQIQGYLKSYLLEQTQQGYKLLWEGEALGTETKLTPMENTLIVDQYQPKIKIDMEHEEMQANIKLAAANGKNALIMMYKPGTAKIDNLENINTVSFQSDNRAALTIKLKDGSIEEQNYTICVNILADKYRKDVSDSFIYLGKTAIAALLAQVENATDSTIETILRQNAAIFGITLDEDSKYYLLKSEYKTAVLRSIQGVAFEQSLLLKTMFNTKVESEYQRMLDDDAKAAALSAINNAVNLSDMKSAIETHCGIINYDTTAMGIYYYLKDDSREKVFTKMYDKTYTKVMDIKSDLDIYGAIEYLNQTPYSELGGVLEKTSAVLGTLFNSDFQGLNESKKFEVYKEIKLGGNITSARELQTLVDKSINYVIEKYKKDNQNTGGGGRIGSAVSIPVAKQETIIPDTTNEMIFKDIESVAWANEAIHKLYQRGVISGRSEGIFEPLADVTREEFVKMLMIACNLKAENSNNLIFEDCIGRWSSEYIATAKKLGIINGTDENKFLPLKSITREDMAVMIYRLTKLAGIGLQNNVTQGNQYTDQAQVEAYAVESVAMLSSNGILNGIGNEFAPKGKANRAMAAKVIYEISKLTE